MLDFYASLTGLEAGQAWPVAGYVALLLALLLGIARYRHLYLRSNEERAYHRDLIENLSEGVYRSLPDGRQLSANKALVRLNGYDTEDELLAAVGDIGDEWYVDPTRRDEFRAILQRRGSVQNFVSEIHRHKTRERIWITESARLVHDKKTGRALFYEGSVRDITETVKRLQAEELLKKLSNQLSGGLFQFSRTSSGQFSITYLSDVFRRLTGYEGTEGPFDPSFFARLVKLEERGTFLQSLRDSGLKLQPWDYEFRTSAPGPDERWLRVNAIPEAVEDGIVWYGYLNDVTSHKLNEKEIEKLAFYDSLTGLPNRRMFMDRMGRAVERCTDRKHCGALLFIDLDNFKTLNDTRGHDVGDQYLTQVARRLERCVRGTDTVARIGGDEFVIILEGAGRDKANAARIAITTANKVLSAMADGFEIDQFHHRSSASIGVVVFTGDDGGPEDILKHADIAMYQAKGAGRNGMALYDHQSMTPESDRYRLLDDFKAAVAANALELHYQPQMDENGCIVGAEALCRWMHPEHGMLLPECFVPLTEQFGMIREFGDVVLAQGVAELARWQQNPATRGLRLAINVNIESFVGESFVPNLTALIERHGVDARLLTFELTESATARDRHLIAKRMHELKALGVRLSLDDFGAGYSSLAQLKRLPFDELKIDGSFIADIETGESDRQLVRSILGTARTLNLTAVAEHVENPHQETFLRAFGCDYFQGYLYSPALTADEFMLFVAARRTAPRPHDTPDERRRA